MVILLETINILNVFFFKHFFALVKEPFRLGRLILCFLTHIAAGDGLKNQTCDILELSFLFLASGIQGFFDLLEDLVELVTSESLL
jgi:hypothetical protein